jgi:hypothetical protein
MSLSRRTLLRTTAVAGTAALAGCSGVLSRGRGPAAAFGDWLYEPGTVADTDHYLALRYTPGAIAERASSFDGTVYDVLKAFGSRSRDIVGFGFAQTDAQLVFGKNSVLTADFESSDVEATLRDDDFAADGTYGEFDVFLGPNEDVAVGIGDSNVVVARDSGIFGGGVEAERILRAIVDTEAGDAQRYVDDDTDFGTLVDELGDGAVQSARSHEETDSTDTDDGEFAGEVARGIGSSFVEDGIETTFALVFDEASDVDTNDIDDWVSANDGDGTFANFESVDVSTSGRTALVTGTEPTRAYDFYLESF